MPACGRYLVRHERIASKGTAETPRYGSGCICCVPKVPTRTVRRPTLRPRDASAQTRTRRSMRTEGGRTVPSVEMSHLPGGIRRAPATGHTCCTSCIKATPLKPDTRHQCLWHCMPVLPHRVLVPAKAGGASKRQFHRLQVHV